MRQVYIISVLLIASVFVFAGCEMFGNDGETEDGTGSGTVSVTYSGDGTHNNKDLVAGIYDDTEDFQNENPIAANAESIAEGTASFTLEEVNDDGLQNGVEWEGTEGKTYYLYIFINDPNEGEDLNTYEYEYQTFPIEYTHSGDKTVDTKQSEFNAVN